MFKRIFMFIENGYTVDLLKEVERQEIEELIGHPFLAERTKFISGLNKWREGQVCNLHLVLRFSVLLKETDSHN